MKILEYLKKLFGLTKEDSIEPPKTAVFPPYHIFRPIPRVERKPLKPKKAIHQDYGRFFKGKGGKGFVATEYRKTIKAKKKLEEN